MAEPGALRRVVLFTVLLPVACLSACRTGPPAPREITVWRPIGSWSGRGLLQTEAFIGETGAFRFRWDVSDDTPDRRGTFRAVLHSSVSGRPLLTAVDHRGPGRDEAFVTEDPREFFVVVHAEHVRWSLAVDEAVRATDTTTGKP